MALKGQILLLFSLSILYLARAQETAQGLVSNSPPFQIDEGHDYEICVNLDAEPSSAVVLTIVGQESAPTVSARAGADFTPANVAVTFQPGTPLISQCVIIIILPDSVVEPLEFFSVSVTSDDVTIVGQSAFTPLIADTTVPVFGFTESSYTVSEGDTTAEVCVTLINSTIDTDVTRSSVVTLSAGSPATATANDDYNPPTTLFTFSAMTPPSGICNQIGAIIIDDDVAENNETYTLSISPDFGTTSPGLGTATVTIIDNDGVSISFDNTEYSVNEGNTGMSPAVNVCLSVTPPSEGLQRNVLVSLTSEEDSADAADFDASTTELTFSDSSTQMCQSINIIGDDLFEGFHSFIVVATAQNILDTFDGPNQATVTIVDGDDRECGNLSDPPNGDVETSGVVFGSTATYSCDEGFEVSEAAESGQTCTDGQGWRPVLEEAICNPASSASSVFVNGLVILLAILVVLAVF